jgi:hypothetical protein
MKLNLIFRILLASLFVTACATTNKSDVDLEELPAKEVNITLLKSSLPSQLFNRKTVFFKDKEGKDVKINIDFSEEKDQIRNNEGFEYTRERGNVIYENKERRILIGVGLSSQLSYQSPTVPQYSIFVVNNVNDHADELLNQIILRYDSASKKLVKSPFTQEIETDIILGKTFKNVFHSTHANDFYKNQLGFNTTYGVVSLNDFDGNLYVFDRFE